MGFDLNGAAIGVQLHALVIYIPDPLGAFLDELRRELVPGCNPHAHVSVLPPRPLAAGVDAACEQAGALAADFAPFEIGAGDIEIFPVTNVIYIGVGSGADELRRMHRAMNSGALAYQEPFPYHPHITLAQEIGGHDVHELRQTASRRWNEFPGDRTFRAERVMFVKSVAQNSWVDLAEFELGAVSPVR
jgi:2'-5' RNA ligase